MKIVSCQEFGPVENLKILDIEPTAPQPGQVQVAVQAAGVGFVDGLLVQGLYQVKPPLPYRPGSEFAGEVIGVGQQVQNLQVGDRVTGLATGTFAEQVTVNAQACTKIPANLSYAHAAGAVINYATALYGLRECGRLADQETVLVLGAGGGVGSAAVAVAKTLGARVIGAASTAAKRAVATAAGADATLDYSNASWRDELKALLAQMPEHQQLNLVYDPVGGELSEPALRSLSPGGRLLVVGFAAGKIAKVPLNLALLKRCSIVGVDWGGEARADPNLTPALLASLVAWMANQTLTPPQVTQRPLSEVRQALAQQLRGEILGKLVLTCQS